MELRSAQSCTKEEVMAGPQSVSAQPFNMYLTHTQTHTWTHTNIQFVCNKESKPCVHTAASGLLPGALWVCNCLVYVRLSESKSNSFKAPFL